MENKIENRKLYVLKKSILFLLSSICLLLSKCNYNIMCMTVCVCMCSIYLNKGVLDCGIESSIRDGTEYFVFDCSFNKISAREKKMV